MTATMTIDPVTLAVVRGALEQIALMAMQTGIGLTRRETIEYAAQVIDIVVQLDRVEGRRGIVALAECRDLAAL